jgi:hypothetical protein
VSGPVDYQACRPDAQSRPRIKRQASIISAIIRP